MAHARCVDLGCTTRLARQPTIGMDFGWRDFSGVFVVAPDGKALGKGSFTMTHSYQKHLTGRSLPAIALLFGLLLA